MRWCSKDMWKAGIALAGMLLLVLVVWIPASAVSTQESALGLATPVTATMQVTPMVDATVTALNKEKLAQEVQPDLFVWLRTETAILFSTLAVVFGGLFGWRRWSVDRREDRLKEHFNRLSSTVTGLGDEKEDARIGAAILLRVFLDQDYEQFYKQVFGLAVANLRLPKTSPVVRRRSRMLYSPAPQADQNAVLPLTPLRQELKIVFQESFPRACKALEKREGKQFSHKSLDASGINLDMAFLWKADLKQIWMPLAFLREADLSEANLEKATLWKGFFHKVKLWGANLEEADLGETDLSEADLTKAHLRKAKLWTNLQKAKLHMADLREANLYKLGCPADLSEANLSGANLSGATLRSTKLVGARLCLARFPKNNPTIVDEPIKLDFSEATFIEDKLSEAELKEAELQEGVFTKVKLQGKVKLNGVDLSEAELQKSTFIRVNLRGANLEEADLSGATIIGADLREAASLKDTNLHGVKGLTKEQLEACKARGANIDETPVTSSSSPSS